MKHLTAKEAQITSELNKNYDYEEDMNNIFFHIEKKASQGRFFVEVRTLFKEEIINKLTDMGYYVFETGTVQHVVEGKQERLMVIWNETHYENYKTYLSKKAETVS